MALAPPAAPPPLGGPPGGAPPLGGPPGGAPPDDLAGADADTGDTVVCTICSNGDGTYTVYEGDEPEEGAGAAAGDMAGAGLSGADAEAMGPGGGAPAGQPAQSIGDVLKAVMGILQSDASSQGAPGSANDQFAGGFAGAGGGGGAGGMGGGAPPGP